MLKEELLFHTGARNYTLEVTPSDLRASNDPRTLTVYIISKYEDEIYFRFNHFTPKFLNWSLLTLNSYMSTVAKRDTN